MGMGSEEQYMPPDRYQIHDGSLLRRLMRHPESDGTVHTERSLARQAGISWSKVHRLITGERPTVTEAQAHLIAESVGVSTKALFAPQASPFGDGNEGGP
jgi:plasmid maintenance system antidote protein VapI